MVSQIFVSRSKREAKNDNSTETRIIVVIVVVVQLSSNWHMYPIQCSECCIYTRKISIAHTMMCRCDVLHFSLFRFLAQSRTLTCFHITSPSFSPNKIFSDALVWGPCIMTMAITFGDSFGCSFGCSFVRSFVYSFRATTALKNE